MREDNKALMFRDLPEWIQDTLRTLSREGYIYIGRTGPGLTYDFRKACMKEGTIKAIDRTMEYHGIEDKILVELIATEGPRWVSYARILEHCTTGLYATLRHQNPSP